MKILLVLLAWGLFLYLPFFIVHTAELSMQEWYGFPWLATWFLFEGLALIVAGILVAHYVDKYSEEDKNDGNN